jgi:hypothetical protein
VEEDEYTVAQWIATPPTTTKSVLNAGLLSKWLLYSESIQEEPKL